MLSWPSARNLDRLLGRVTNVLKLTGLLQHVAFAVRPDKIFIQRLFAVVVGREGRRSVPGAPAEPPVLLGPRCHRTSHGDTRKLVTGGMAYSSCISGAISR